jgi:Domain of unknown function (DUF5615)
VTPKFLVDEHIDAAVARGLRRRGLDAVTVAEAGRRGESDEDHLRWALSAGRVMVTFDDDYLVLNAQGAAHAGIAFCSDRKHGVGGLIRAIENLSSVVTAEQAAGRVIFL